MNSPCLVMCMPHQKPRFGPESTLPLPLARTAQSGTRKRLPLPKPVVFTADGMAHASQALADEWTRATNQLRNR